jgi:hypothetical protein
MGQHRPRSTNGQWRVLVGHRSRVRGGDLIRLLNQAEVPNTAFNLPLSGLSVGVHVVGFRTRTSNGIWSHTNCSPINIVAQPSTEPIELTEYFLNNDPGYGAGTDANADGTPNVQDAMYTASLASLVPGVNILFSPKPRRTRAMEPHECPAIQRVRPPSAPRDCSDGVLLEH